MAPGVQEDKDGCWGCRTMRMWVGIQDGGDRGRWAWTLGIQNNEDGRWAWMVRWDDGHERWAWAVEMQDSEDGRWG